MGMLIITGLPGSRLTEIEAHLCQNGMARPLALPAASIPSVNAWMRRAGPTLGEKGAGAPGRLLELAVGEILLANIDQPLWGWADERHVALLDFWLTLDADAQFLFLFTDPPRFLAERCTSAEEQPDFHGELEHWKKTTAHLLNFYLRNPSRCGVSLLSHWQERPEAVGVALDGRLSKDMLSRLAPLAPTDPELLWLCGQVAARDTPAMQLWSEVEALIDIPGTTADEVGPEIAIRECLRRLRPLRAQAAALAHETEPRCEAEACRHAVALDEARRRARSEIDALRARIRDMTFNLETKQRENDSLVRQLADFVQARPLRPNTLAAASEDADREKNLLLAQLHQVQEELERTYLLYHAVEDEKAALLAAFERLAARNPASVDYETASITQDAPGVLAVHLQALRVGALLIPSLEMMFVASESDIALVVPSGQESVAWTGTGDEAPLVYSTAHPEDAPERLRVSTLSTSAWSVVRALPAATLVALRQQAIDAPGWRDLLEALGAQMQKPELRWRWDQITLRQEQVNPDYEHLWVRLSGASFGLQRWSAFEFRIAAAEVKDRVFSGHLKYEFPQLSETVPQFEHWRADIHDELGARFELRFDLGRNMFDVETWRSLSTTDHQRFAGLLIALPFMLEGLRARGFSISRPWSDWEELNRAAISVLLRLAQAVEQDG